MSPFVRHFSDAVFFPSDEGKLFFAPFGIGTRLYEVPVGALSDRLARRFACVQIAVFGLFTQLMIIIFVCCAAIGSFDFILEPLTAFGLIGGAATVHYFAIWLAIRRPLRGLITRKRLTVRMAAARLATTTSTGGLIYTFAVLLVCGMFYLFVAIAKSSAVGMFLSVVCTIFGIYFGYACLLRKQAQHTVEQVLQPEALPNVDPPH